MAAYKMRMLTLELWQKWHKIRLHLRCIEPGQDGTNNATERSIGRSNRNLLEQDVRVERSRPELARSS
jgi:hypothetical protein